MASPPPPATDGGGTGARPKTSHTSRKKAQPPPPPPSQPVIKPKKSAKVSGGTSRAKTAAATTQVQKKPSSVTAVVQQLADLTLDTADEGDITTADEGDVTQGNVTMDEVDSDRDDDRKKKKIKEMAAHIKRIEELQAEISPVQPRVRTDKSTRQRAKTSYGEDRTPPRRSPIKRSPQRRRSSERQRSPEKRRINLQDGRALGQYNGKDDLEIFLAKFEETSKVCGWGEVERTDFLKSSLTGAAGTILIEV